MKVHVIQIHDLNDGSHWIEGIYTEDYFAKMEVDILKPIFGVHYKLEVLEFEVKNACPVKITKECM